MQGNLRHDLPLDTSTQSRKKFTDDDYFLFVKNKLSIWVNYHKKENPCFDIWKFKRRNEMAFSGYSESKYAAPKTLDDSLRTTLFCWSPDSNYFIDVLSYRYIFWTENGKTILEGGDPESEVALTSLKDSVTYRMEYIGTTGSYEDAMWMDDTRLIFTGSCINDKCDSIQYYFAVCDIRKQTKIYFVGEMLPVNDSVSNSPSFVCLKFPQYCDDEEMKLIRKKSK